MQVSLRPSMLAGVALLGGSAVVAGTATPLIDAPDVRSPAVRLTATDDVLLQSLIDTFNETSNNATRLADNFYLAPFVDAQQQIVNNFDYAQELLNGKSLQDVLAELSTSQQIVQSGISLMGASDSTLQTVLGSTLDSGHYTLFQQLPYLLSLTAEQSQILDYLASPASAVLIGTLGPVVSPFVEFFNDVDAISTALGAGDTTGAVNELLSLPTNVLGAFFNGATLDLSSLIPSINDAGLLPDGTTVGSLSFAFGGLFSAGVVQNFWTGAGAFQPDPDAPGGAAFNPIFATGGSILNALGLQLQSEVSDVPNGVAGQGIGPIGASIALEQIIGRLLGDGWSGDYITDGKTGAGRAGNPLEGLTFPTIPDTDGTPIGAAAAGGLDGFTGLDSDLTGALSGINDLSAELSAEASAWLTSVTDLSQEYVQGLLALF